jgi:hypothetical protein
MVYVAVKHNAIPPYTIVCSCYLLNYGDEECNWAGKTSNEEEAAVAINWQSGDSDNNRSDNSGSYENLEDELGYLLHKRGAWKGSDERDPDYIPEEEVW